MKIASKIEYKYWDKPQLNLAKTKTKWLKTEMKLMTVVLGEWVLTTEFVELEIRKSIYDDLDAENLNLHHEKM